MNPFSFLKQWWKTRTVVSRLSTAVVGCAATIAVIASFANGNMELAGLFILSGFASIIGMSLVQRAIANKTFIGRLLATVVGLVLSASIILVFTSVFFKWPLDFRRLAPSPPPPNGISLSALQTFLRDADGGPDSDRLARAMGRDITHVATDNFPVTGDRGSTDALALTSLDQIFMQSPSSVVKIQLFPLPPSARQVRGLSLRRFDDGSNFVADAWAFVVVGGRLIPCEKSGEDNYSNWQIPAGAAAQDPKGARFLLIAVYPNIHFFVNRADSVTLALDDLAGQIRELNVAIVGSFSDFRVTRIFEFGRDLVFSEVPDSRVVRRRHEVPEILATFTDVLERFKTEYVGRLGAEGERRRAQEVVNVWDYCRAQPKVGDAISIRNVSSNVELFVMGGIALPSSSVASTER